MNINQELWSYAELCGLDWHSSGGNCDFIIVNAERIQTNIEAGWPVIVQLSDGEGSTPDTLIEPATVSFFFGECHEQSIDVDFPTAKIAIQFMAAIKKVRSESIVI